MSDPSATVAASLAQARAAAVQNACVLNGVTPANAANHSTKQSLKRSTLVQDSHTSAMAIKSTPFTAKQIELLAKLNPKKPKNKRTE
jgi:hypothetical protein